MNPSQSSIGEKIRNYRKRAGLSQLELEVAISASNGMISRIESGQTNPTKETLKLIGQSLKLSRGELATLFGIDQPAITPEDINNVRSNLSEHFSNPEVFSLLLDRRWNVVMASEGFYLNLGIPRELLSKMIGMNLMEIIFSPSLGIRQIIGNAEEFYPHELALFYQELADQQREPWFKSLEEKLSTYPKFSDYLEKAKNIKEPFLSTGRQKTIHIQLGDTDVMLVPQFRHLNIDNRFEIIDYIAVS